MMHNTHELLET